MDKQPQDFDGFDKAERSSFALFAKIQFLRKLKKVIAELLKNLLYDRGKEIVQILKLCKQKFQI